MNGRPAMLPAKEVKSRPTSLGNCGLKEEECIQLLLLRMCMIFAKKLSEQIMHSHILIELLTLPTQE